MIKYSSSKFNFCLKEPIKKMKSQVTGYGSENGNLIFDIRERQ